MVAKIGGGGALGVMSVPGSLEGAIVVVKEVAVHLQAVAKEQVLRADLVGRQGFSLQLQHLRLAGYVRGNGDIARRGAGRNHRVQHVA